MLTVLLRLVATVVLWQETVEERVRRAGGTNVDAVACPTRGYHLTGLSDTRCPDCGSRFTLDQLLTGQLGRLGNLE